MSDYNQMQQLRKLKEKIAQTKKETSVQEVMIFTDALTGERLIYTISKVKRDGKRTQRNSISEAEFQQLQKDSPNLKVIEFIDDLELEAILKGGQEQCK